jgi:hypothetical protein
VALAALGTLAALAALTGCGSIGDSQQAVDRARLVSDFAERLSRSGDLTYTARYQLPGGAVASIAQDQRPRRVAYTYLRGKLVITPGQIADCETEANVPTCTLKAPPTGNGSTAVAVTVTHLLGSGSDRTLIPPAGVVGLLTAASLSTNAVVEQSDTTVGGEHATCVKVAGVENASASTFTACLTVAGVLGSFSGVVDGRDVEVALTGYDETTAADAFDLPPGAKVVDQRPR